MLRLAATDSNSATGRYSRITGEIPNDCATRACILSKVTICVHEAAIAEAR